jgi:nucleotide-binding universal stress UspA family protein
MPGIVVGVDGSFNSECALAWAMQEAAIRTGSLTVLAIHPVPKSYWGNTPVVVRRTCLSCQAGGTCASTAAVCRRRRVARQMLGWHGRTTQSAASRFHSVP